jgi:hypothetical protein
MIELKEKIDQIYPPSALLVVLTFITLGISVFLIYTLIHNIGVFVILIVIAWIVLTVILLQNSYKRMRIFHLYKSDNDMFLAYLKQLHENKLKKNISEESKQYKKIKLLGELISDIELET